MALNEEVRSRIFDAADKLHAESPDGAFPNVDAVRQLSRANMNSVVEVMKDWRQKQRKQVQAIKEPLPADLLGVMQAMGQSFWETAQLMANESLSAARTAFEAEKGDLIQLSHEQSESFEKQSLELTAANEKLAEQGRAAELATEAYRVLASDAESTRASLSEALQKGAIATQRAEEIERRAGDLRAELDRAHDEHKTSVASVEVALKRAERAEDRADEARQAIQTITEKSEGIIDKLRAELAEARSAVQVSSELTKSAAARLAKAETDRDAALAKSASAREEAAALRGQLEATTSHVSRLENARDAALQAGTGQGVHKETKDQGKAPSGLPKRSRRKNASGGA